MTGNPDAQAAPSTPSIGHNGGPALDAEYWYGLIGEKDMASFLNVTARSLQKWRQTGAGPKFVRLSARCVKYRRIDGREHSEARLRSSTSDPDPEVEVATT